MVRYTRHLAEHHPPTASPAACTTTLQVAQFPDPRWLTRIWPTKLPGARVSVCIDDASFGSGGLPVWDCSGTGGTVVVKIGWTQATTDHAAYGSSSYGTSTPGPARATRPGVVVAPTAGSSE